jgi:hypothetical protein
MTVLSFYQQAFPPNASVINTGGSAITLPSWGSTYIVNPLSSSIVVTLPSASISGELTVILNNSSYNLSFVAPSGATLRIHTSFILFAAYQNVTFYSDGLGNIYEKSLDYSVLATSATLANGDYGDITVSGSGTVFTIDPQAVTVGKMRFTTNYTIAATQGSSGAPSQVQMTSGSTLIGRSASGGIGMITLGGGLTMTGSVLSSVALADVDRGDITVSGLGTVWTIDNGAVTLPKMAQVSTNTFLGRTSAGVGDVEYLSASTLINAAVPTQSGNTDRVLTTDGSVVSWARVKPEILLASTPSQLTGTSYTIVDGDAGKLLYYASGATFTLTTPTSNTGFYVGWWCEIMAQVATDISLVTGSGTVIYFDSKTHLRKVGAMARLTYLSTGTWAVAGQLEA